MSKTRRVGLLEGEAREIAIAKPRMRDGIAIDIDPDRNPCCGCVDPWPNHRYCKSGAKSVFEKTELTRCWIDSFERHGFYWLGHDSLEDTMHFEYLGDPDR